MPTNRVDSVLDSLAALERPSRIQSHHALEHSSASTASNPQHHNE